VKTFVLVHHQARLNAIEAVKTAPDGWMVQVKEKTRSIEANSRYWGQGILAQIADQVVMNGGKYSAEVWHEQFKQMFLGVEELPSGQVIGKSSAKLSVKAFSEFTEQVEAYAVTSLGVVFQDEPIPVKTYSGGKAWHVQTRAKNDEA
jgi:hypothetical protein